MFLALMMSASVIPGRENKMIKTKSGKVTLTIVSIIMSLISTLLLLVATSDGAYSVMVATAKETKIDAGFTIWYFLSIACATISAAIKGFYLYTLLTDKNDN